MPEHGLGLTSRAGMATVRSRVVEDQARARAGNGRVAVAGDWGAGPLARQQEPPRRL